MYRSPLGSSFLMALSTAAVTAGVTRRILTYDWRRLTTIGGAMTSSRGFRTSLSETMGTLILSFSFSHDFCSWSANSCYPATPPLAFFFVPAPSGLYIKPSTSPSLEISGFHQLGIIHWKHHASGGEPTAGATFEPLLSL
ncbi:hypothetical protein NL676_003272 [Syzygium grande]|nr:hypothetical protein NL676_003272 [Syzygium grande]